LGWFVSRLQINQIHHLFSNPPNTRFSYISTRTDRGGRAVGPGVIEAFYAGLDTIEPSDYDYLCKLDLDLDLPEKYFEHLIERMEADISIGSCSGKAYIKSKDGYVSERHGDDTSIRASKFYRTSVFLAIGGFVREVMWDGIDCHRCRMRGWKALSWDTAELRFIHLRPMGSSQKGIWSGRKRHGFGQYFMGTSFIYLFASAMLRLNEKPYFVGSVGMLWGWLSSALQGLPRYEDKEFRTFLRRKHPVIPSSSGAPSRYL